jgi:putative peptidoglycan lipid II flippase
VNLGLNLILVRLMGFRGLALGTAISAILNAAILLVLLGRRLDGLDASRIVSSAARISLATVVMGAVAWYSSGWLSAAVPGIGFWVRLFRVAASIAAALVALALAARLFRVEEFDAALRTVRARIAGRAAGTKSSQS